MFCEEHKIICSAYVDALCVVDKCRFYACSHLPICAEGNHSPDLLAHYVRNHDALEYEIQFRMESHALVWSMQFVGLLMKYNSLIEKFSAQHLVDLSQQLDRGSAPRAVETMPVMEYLRHVLARKRLEYADFYGKAFEKMERNLQRQFLDELAQADAWIQTYMEIVHEWEAIARRDHWDILSREKSREMQNIEPRLRSARRLLDPTEVEDESVYTHFLSKTGWRSNMKFPRRPNAQFIEKYPSRMRHYVAISPRISADFDDVFARISTQVRSLASPSLGDLIARAEADEASLGVSSVSTSTPRRTRSEGHADEKVDILAPSAPFEEGFRDEMERNLALTQRTSEETLVVDEKVCFDTHTDYQTSESDEEDWHGNRRTEIEYDGFDRDEMILMALRQRERNVAEAKSHGQEDDAAWLDYHRSMPQHGREARHMPHLNMYNVRLMILHEFTRCTSLITAIQEILTQNGRPTSAKLSALHSEVMTIYEKYLRDYRRDRVVSMELAVRMKMRPVLSEDYIRHVRNKICIQAQPTLKSREAIATRDEVVSSISMCGVCRTKYAVFRDDSCFDRCIDCFEGERVGAVRRRVCAGECGHAAHYVKRKGPKDITYCYDHISDEEPLIHIDTLCVMPNCRHRRRISALLCNVCAVHLMRSDADSPRYVEISRAIDNYLRQKIAMLSHMRHIHISWYAEIYHRHASTSSLGTYTESIEARTLRENYRGIVYPLMKFPTVADAWRNLSVLNERLKRWSAYCGMLMNVVSHEKMSTSERMIRNDDLGHFYVVQEYYPLHRRFVVDFDAHQGNAHHSGDSDSTDTEVIHIGTSTHDANEDNEDEDHEDANEDHANEDHEDDEDDEDNDTSTTESYGSDHAHVSEDDEYESMSR